MTGFYNVLEKIKDTLNAEPFVNTITYGNIDDVDLNKQSISKIQKQNSDPENTNKYLDISRK